MTPEPTAHVLRLAHALEGKGVVLKLEHWDGHKHVDIFIPSARLYIEVNGLYHYTDPKQVMRDLKRNHFSDGDDFDTSLRSNPEAINLIIIPFEYRPTIPGGGKMAL